MNEPGLQWNDEKCLPMADAASGHLRDAATGSFLVLLTALSGRRTVGSGGIKSEGKIGVIAMNIQNIFFVVNAGFFQSACYTNAW